MGMREMKRAFSPYAKVAWSNFNRITDTTKWARMVKKYCIFLNEDNTINTIQLWSKQATPTKLFKLRQKQQSGHYPTYLELKFPE